MCKSMPGSRRGYKFIMDSDSESCVEVTDMLNLQLSEVEMLSSMYPTEFRLDDPLAVMDIKQFLEGVLQYDKLFGRIGFTISIELENKNILEMVCHLPHEYPSVLPNVFIRGSSLPRAQHQRLYEDLHSYISEQEQGEICMGPIVQWIKDNAENYVVKSDDNGTPEMCSKVKDTFEKHFSRMWIYSHHIYSKIKRKDILDFSSELNLTGFSMPGKPGIIVIEGTTVNVEEFWHRIRRMQWKKLTMKEKEDFEVCDKKLDDFRIFANFEEKYFEPRQSKGRGAHADRGLLYQFLEERQYGHMFTLYFGVDGKSSQD